MEMLGLLKSSWKLVFSAMAWCLRRLLGRLVRPLLLQTHQYHLDLRSWQCRWQPLNDTLEYKLVLASVLTDDPAPMSCVWLRNVGSESIRDLSVSVVARNGRLQFSDTVSVPQLDVAAVDRQRLANIPLQNVWCSGENIRMSYQTVRVVLNSYECRGKLELPRQRTLEANIMYSDFFDAGSWTRFQGRLYNIKAVDHYITHHQQLLYHHLAGKHGFFPLCPKSQLAFIMEHRHYSALPRSLCYLILSQRPLVAAFCWAKLLVQRPTIRFEEGRGHWWSEG